MKRRLNILFLESFYGGSHREFADGLAARSRHRIELGTLPARHWKWRMRGAALSFLRQFPSLDAYDGVIVTGLMSLSDLLALSRGAFPPVMLYFHENQLTYPLSPGETMDYQYGFTNITTALAADAVVFNSHVHRAAFFDRLPKFIQMMPDNRPKWLVKQIQAKSRVLYPGCRFPGTSMKPMDRDSSEPPLVIWNHRWEFDKNPDDFFSALSAVMEQGMEFRIALLGEHFKTAPTVFDEAIRRFGDRIVHRGYVPSRKAYIEWLKKGDIVISSALQENFGIAIVEAVRYGCFPLLPNRLSYPEIIPQHLHGRVLYQDQEDLVQKLTDAIHRTRHCDAARDDLSNAMARFSWDHLIQEYDEALAALCMPVKGMMRNT